MATLNGQYLWVESEEYSFGVDVTEHTVEDGVNISDHVKRNAATLSLSGEIVGQNAGSIRTKLKQMHQQGVVCSYSGRSTMSNCLIVDFSTSHPVDIWGGCSFTMALKEIRTASASYVTITNTKKSTDKTGTQQVNKASTAGNIYYTVKKGDTIWGLVAAKNAPFKSTGLTCNQVMKMNPDAFSRPGDFRTLKIGYRLNLGTRK